LGLRLLLDCNGLLLLLHQVVTRHSLLQLMLLLQGRHEYALVLLLVGDHHALLLLWLLLLHWLGAWPPQHHLRLCLRPGLVEHGTAVACCPLVLGLLLLGRGVPHRPAGRGCACAWHGGGIGHGHAPRTHGAWRRVGHDTHWAAAGLDHRHHHAWLRRQVLHLLLHGPQGAASHCQRLLLRVLQLPHGLLLQRLLLLLLHAQLLELIQEFIGDAWRAHAILVVVLLLLVDQCIHGRPQGRLPQLGPLMCKEAQRAVALFAVPAHLSAEPASKHHQVSARTVTTLDGQCAGAQRLRPAYLSGWSQYSYTLWL
jgi:hypothetical protein